jgi:hypothetical protein
VRQVAGSDRVVDNLGAHPNGVMIITLEYRFIVIFTAAEGRKPAATTEEFAALKEAKLLTRDWSRCLQTREYPKDLKLINKVDTAWNEEWTGTVQTGFLSR